MSKNIDPRYDPVFQRGYEGGTAVPSKRQPASAVSAPAPSVGLPPPAAPVPAVGAPQPGGAFVGPAVTVEVLGDDPAPGARVRVVNPFIVLLWLFGPALVVGASWVAFQSFTEQNPGYISQEQMAVRQFFWVMSPAFVTAGLVIIGGLLFWHAAAFRRARNQRGIREG